MIILERAIRLHDVSIEKYGGMSGIRDEGLLISALNRPFKGIGDLDFYPTVIEKAAVLIHGVISNHPFFDGNKRTGIGLGMTYLLMNQLEIIANEDELYDFVVAIASGQMELDSITAWLEKNTKAT